MDLVHALVSVQRAIGHRLSPILHERYGLDLRLFVMIKRIQAGVAFPGALARGSMETPSQVTRQLDKLEALGFVARSLDQHDSRRIRLELTPRAEALVRDIDGAVAGLIGPVLGDLDPERRRDLVPGLRQVAEGLAGPP